MQWLGLVPLGVTPQVGNNAFQRWKWSTWIGRLFQTMCVMTKLNSSSELLMDWSCSGGVVCKSFRGCLPLYFRSCFVELCWFSFYISPLAFQNLSNTIASFIGTTYGFKHTSLICCIKTREKDFKIKNWNLYIEKFYYYETPAIVRRLGNVRYTTWNSFV